MFFNFYPKNLRRVDNHTGQKSTYTSEIVWRNIVGITVLHLIALYGFYLWVIVWKLHLWTFIFHFSWALAASLGVTGGAHRLWAHKCYKANTRLRTLYAILMSMIFANDIYTWVRDHRAHHKYAETDADPHNARRGFFFAHMGWLMVRRHPDVVSRGAFISYADLDRDPIVMFQKRYYMLLMPFGTFVLPTIIPWYFWQQQNALTFSVLRYIINIHLVWSLNSFAHLFGTKPYDKHIYATQNTMMMCVALGEGFHNYHHVFPWDYKAAELGDDGRNLTTFLIHLFAKIGWATELKTPSPQMIRDRALRTGDGSWSICCNSQQQSEPNTKNEEVFWGWDDPDISIATKNQASIL